MAAKRVKPKLKKMLNYDYLIRVLNALNATSRPTVVNAKGEPCYIYKVGGRRKPYAQLVKPS